MDTKTLAAWKENCRRQRIDLRVLRDGNWKLAQELFDMTAERDALAHKLVEMEVQKNDILKDLNTLWLDVDPESAVAE